VSNLPSALIMTVALSFSTFKLKSALHMYGDPTSVWSIGLGVEESETRVSATSISDRRILDSEMWTALTWVGSAVLQSDSFSNSSSSEGGGSSLSSN
jgi:hypothetical protein